MTRAEPPEPYFAYEVVEEAQRVVQLQLTVRSAGAGVCLSWTGAAEGTALGPLDAAGAVLLHALGQLLGHPQPGLPDNDTQPTDRRQIPIELLRPSAETPR